MDLLRLISFTQLLNSSLPETDGLNSTWHRILPCKTLDLLLTASHHFIPAIVYARFHILASLLWNAFALGMELTSNAVLPKLETDGPCSTWHRIIPCMTLDLLLTASHQCIPAMVYARYHILASLLWNAFALGMELTSNAVISKLETYGPYST